MNRNPLIPFAFIAVLGLGLMFLLSFVGLDQAEKIASGEDETVELSAEELYQQNSCIGCHGGNLEGAGAAPALTDVGDRLSQEEIQNVIVNGQGAMPAGLATPKEAEVLAEWLANGAKSEEEGEH
ncbi:MULTISPECIES: cytochrome c550 [unclassified Bacillus (in: firmicutes)]|jgi:cytochrome c550|uniref:cytochrome c550 n=1 Tax=unclassified Bacillus (in: firmicutes) TaxID=185979 RepID=UPI0014569047|nr:MULTISPECIES: cytochrome c [unclassified Bacillus (in: firmicutes)]MEA3318945.1 cytochrome c [Bacillota bacterium]NLP49126.1 cytochrome c [Bacillus sp. RO1]NMH74846.1 cytochrome c [Bacillus sp. RO2]